MDLLLSLASDWQAVLFAIAALLILVAGAKVAWHLFWHVVKVGIGGLIGVAATFAFFSAVAFFFLG